LFIVSQVALENGTPGGLQIAIERAAGQKCERCWKYKSEVGSDSEFPTICMDCKMALMSRQP
jgi:isoleucyl-tRNA synthetase